MLRRSVIHFLAPVLALSLPALAQKPAKPAAKPAAPKPAAPEPESTLKQLVAWSAIAELPTVPGQPKPGLSGVFAGALDDNRAVVAGGSFFGEKGPLEGGGKQFTDAVFVLEKKPAAVGDGVVYTWVEQPTKLARPLAHGVSVNVEGGVFCAGGTDGKTCVAEAFLLAWNEAERRVERTELPPLPKTLAWAGAGASGSWVIVAGGASAPGAASGTDVFALDLSKRGGDAAAFQWESLPALPVAAHFPVCTGSEGSFWVFSGRDLTPGQPPKALTDGHRLDLATRTWTPAGAIQPAGAPKPAAVVAGSAVPLEAGRIIVLGGDDADVATFLEAAATRGTSVEEREAWARFVRTALEAHPGYRREELLFDTRSSTWSVAGHFPQGTPAAAPAFLWDGALVLAGGEPRPGHRSATVWLGKFEAE